MAESFSDRRSKLQRALILVQELIRLNDSAEQMDSELESQGISQAEREITIDALFDGAGPPQKAGPANLDECTGDTVTDRIINILNEAVSGGVDWESIGAASS